MSLNIDWDTIQFSKCEFPYNRIEAELSETPRIFRGLNSYISYGGKLGKRSGTTKIDNTDTTKRCDRLWTYETLESPPKIYIIGSFYNPTTGYWELYYNRLSGGSPGWTAVPTYRDSQRSTRPHVLAVSRGLAYITCFPSSGSSEKLGTIVFDGSGNSSPVTRPWGLLGPTTPAALVGSITRTTADITASATTINCDDLSTFPATPFIIQIDFEQINVTTVVGDNITACTRGYNGTTAEAHVANSIVIYRDWSASDHRVDVNWYWRYSYCWKTVTGQLSNRAPIETNVDKLPSSTGPFIDLIPKFTLTCPVDTTNFPKLVVFRSTDGGGTYFDLEEITNLGVTPFTYEDDSLETGPSGGVFQDPVPDNLLDTSTNAPSLTTNSPPPTVLAPLETGVDTPAACTPIAYYSGRFWKGIGNVVFFSGLEEISEGIPEECWPSGLRGNFFRFQYPITNLVGTADALYIFTIQSIYQITGTNRETFSVRPIFDNIGHPYGHPLGVTRWGDTIAFLTHDFRIAVASDSQLIIVSDPLFTDIVDQSSLYSAQFDLKYWGDIDKEYLVVTGHVISDTSASRQWVMDIKKTGKKSNFQEYESFWYTPWTIRSTASLSARITEGTGQRRLVFFVWNNTDNTGCLVMQDPTGRTGTDWYPSDNADDGSNIGFDFYIDTNLYQSPVGNHVHTLRVGSLTSVMYGFIYDRTLYPADIDPQHFVYLDDFWSNPIPVDTSAPWRRKASIGYKTTFCAVNQVCNHTAIRIQKVNSTDLFEMQNLVIIFNNANGA